MSDAHGTTDNGDLDLVAAEYVLGTLDLEERAAFTRRLTSDEAAKTSVGRWELRFAELADRLDPEAPPAHVWDAIDRTVRTEGLKVIEGGRRLAPDNSVALRSSRNRWRVGALLSGTIAAVLALAVVALQLGRVETPAPGDVYVAAVNRDGNKPALIVRVDMATGTVLVRPVAADTPAGKSLELWYIDQGQAPKSMGVLDNDTVTVPLPEKAKGDAATFAVSVEPTGGSKTGAPTGPVVYSGQLVKE